MPSYALTVIQPFLKEWKCWCNTDRHSMSRLHGYRSIR